MDHKDYRKSGKWWLIRGLGVPISRSYRALINVLGGDLAVAINKSIFLEFSKSADSLGFQSLHKLCDE